MVKRAARGGHEARDIWAWAGVAEGGLITGLKALELCPVPPLSLVAVRVRAPRTARPSEDYMESASSRDELDALPFFRPKVPEEVRWDDLFWEEMEMWREREGRRAAVKRVGWFALIAVMLCAAWMATRPPLRAAMVSWATMDHAAALEGR